MPELEFKKDLFNKFFPELEGDLEDLILILPDTEDQQYTKYGFSWIVSSKNTDIILGLNLKVIQTDLGPYVPFTKEFK